MERAKCNGSLSFKFSRCAVIGQNGIHVSVRNSEQLTHNTMHHQVHPGAIVLMKKVLFSSLQ